MSEFKHITESYKVYSSQVDNEGKIKLSVLTKLFQDLIDKEDNTYRKGKHDESKAWMLLNYDINIYSHPKLFDDILIETYPYSFNRLYGDRIFLVQNEKGEILIEAKTKWFMVDVKTLKVVKTDESLIEGYGVSQIDKGTGFPVEKFKKDIFKEDAISNEIKIRREDIDFNKHVNNTNYFSYIYEILPKELLEKYDIYKICINYKMGITYPNNVNIFLISLIEEESFVSYIKLEKEDTLFTNIKIVWKEKQNED